MQKAAPITVDDMNAAIERIEAATDTGAGQPGIATPQPPVTSTEQNNSTPEPQAPADSKSEAGERWDAMSYAQREKIAQDLWGAMRNVVHRVSGSKWAELVANHEARHIEQAFAKMDAAQADAEAQRKARSQAKRAVDRDLFNALADLPELQEHAP